MHRIPRPDPQHWLANKKVGGVEPMQTTTKNVVSQENIVLCILANRHSRALSMPAARHLSRETNDNKYVPKLLNDGVTHNVDFFHRI
jgi:hypothetical protein